jgi:hypothetical protein
MPYSLPPQTSSMNTQGDQRRNLHVLVVGTTGMLAELVDQTIKNQPDMQLLGHLEQWMDITAELGIQADVVVVEVEAFDPEPEPCIHLICTFPHLRILMLTNQDNSAIAYWLGLHHHHLHIASSQMLVDSIRQLRDLNSLQRF